MDTLAPTQPHHVTAPPPAGAHHGGSYAMPQPIDDGAQPYDQSMYPSAYRSPATAGAPAGLPDSLRVQHQHQPYAPAGSPTATLRQHNPYAVSVRMPSPPPQQQQQQQQAFVPNPMLAHMQMMGANGMPHMAPPMMPGMGQMNFTLEQMQALHEQAAAMAAVGAYGGMQAGPMPGAPLFPGAQQTPSQHQQGAGGNGQQRGRHGGNRHNNRHNSTDGEDSAKGIQNSTVTLQQLLAAAGSFVEMSRTSTGSSFIQAALKEHDAMRVEVIWGELEAHAADLLLDSHGCYVMKTLLESMQPELHAAVVQRIAADEQLLFSMCTHSLHTRRVVQYLLERGVGTSIVSLMISRCQELATTQQGCIAMQRSLDNAGELFDTLCHAIYPNLYAFSKDPFANYVVQYLLEKDHKDRISQVVLVAFRGQVADLACNKFASNVVEKCLVNLSPHTQHQLLTEMYSVSEDVLVRMLQDSFGNYIIQTSIALACSEDIAMIDQKLRSALKKTPYGYKIEARLDRRLKGKSVASRLTSTGSSGKHSGEHHGGRAPRGGHPRGTGSNNSSIVTPPHHSRVPVQQPPSAMQYSGSTSTTAGTTPPSTPPPAPLQRQHNSDIPSDEEPWE